MLRLFNSRLLVRLTVLFLVAGLTPALGGGWLALRALEGSVLREAERRQETFAGLCASLVETSIERAEEKLATIARLMARELSEKKVGDYAESNVRYKDAVLARLRQLVVPRDAFAQAGDVFLELQYFAAGEEPQFVAQVQEPAYEAAQRELPAYEERAQLQILSNVASDLVQTPFREGAPSRAPALDTYQGYTTLAISQPVGVGPGGASLGVLIGYVDFAELERGLRAAAGTDWSVRIRDGRGTELAALGEAGPDSIGVDAAIGDTGWSSSVREPRARVEEPLRRLRRQVLWGVGIALLLALVLSLALSSWITRPVERLRAAAEAMERGDLAARARIGRSDEIGRLGAAFDRMAAALHRLDEAKSEFVGNVSHELRTPLTSMRLSVANLLDGVVGELDGRQRGALERVQRELERTIELVDDLLEMARLEAGVVEPRREPVDLAALARECAEALERPASARGIALEVRGEGGASADRGMLRRVVTNLLENAIKFSPEGGRVEIRAGEDELRVSDQGPGVQDAGVFEKFRQGRQEGVKNPGVGLGLAMVAKLVQLHGGSVRVERAALGGAEFVVCLREAPG